MFAFRCTRRLLNALHAEPVEVPAGPTTRLGDWYGNVLFVEHHRLVMFVSGRSLLTVLLPLRERENLLANFRSRLAELLVTFGAPEGIVTAELAEMGKAEIATALDASLLGSLRDLARSAKAYLRTYPDCELIDVELELAESPCGPLPLTFPSHSALKLLAVEARRAAD